MVPKGARRTFALRFHAYGRRHYVHLGRPEDGWDLIRAEVVLRHILADVERGIWVPPSKAEVAEPSVAPSFRAFSSQWFDRRRREWAPRTQEDYGWALRDHLLPFFGGFRLDEISIESIDAYKATKLAAGALSASSINKTLKRLSQILAEAVEYGYLDRNPASGPRRRLRARQPVRHWVEPEQLMALLDAAEDWHRPLLATLAGAGLRVGEACALNWSDINLQTASITVSRAKTDAGVRHVDLPRGLQQELRMWQTRSPRARAGDPLFVCRGRGGEHTRQERCNVARRLKAAIGRANANLDRLGIEPIDQAVTPHSLRRTYASLRAALGDDPVYIAEQLGHTDARFTFRVYQKAAKRRSRLSGAYLDAFDRACRWAQLGTIVPLRGAAFTEPRPGRFVPDIRTGEATSTVSEAIVPYARALVLGTGSLLRLR